MRMEPVLRESSNLQHVVKKQLEHITHIHTLNFASILDEMTAGSYGNMHIDHLSCMLRIM